jgi:serine/threonine protein kinase/Tol biopolymer transport system component
LIGKQLGPYQVLARIGAGGMGEVYRARDARLSRDVAIKVLPDLVAADADRLRRFAQEARAIAALNHPNILTIYDIGDYEGAPYIVAELLEGEELRAELKKGPIEQRRALDYAQQVAHGLAAAHEQGIVHRDLKPENLFVTKDGRVKILDFGLAKLRQPAEATVTLSEHHTRPGTVLGTVAYMSPEQVRGEEATHRADIFALGVILYEMLSGRRTFSGASSVEVMNAILKEEPPPLEESNARIHPQLARIVRRCLEKREQQRFQSASDLAFDLEALSEQSGAHTSTLLKRGNTRARYVWPALTAALLLALLWFAFLNPPRVRDDSVARFQVALPEKATFIPTVDVTGLSVAPDGCCLAFVAATEGRRTLWLRRLDTIAAQALPGTADAHSPFWSPDSRFIAFFAEGRLKKIAIAGGAPQTICELSITPGGAAWGSAGVILVGGSGADSNGLYRVADTGGAATLLLKGEEHVGYWPSFLPDGRHFLYFSNGTDKPTGIYIGSLDSAGVRLLLPGNSRGVYAPPGYLLFAREGGLLAQAFDAAGLRLTGSPFAVAERVASFDPAGWGEFAAGNGTLAYYTYPPTSFTWFDRGGRQGASVVAPGFYQSYRLARDGRRVAFTAVDAHTGRGDIWLAEFTRNSITRLTSDPGDHGGPVWSPDGTRLAFFGFHSLGKTTLSVKSLDETAAEEHPAPNDWFVLPTDWSLDGEYIAYTDYLNDPGTGANIWFLPLAGDRKPIPFLRTRFNESLARFSPNRRWVAYESDESGRNEVYVRAFDGSGEKTRISTDGGTRACWRRDGTELFYLSGDNQLMAVPVRTAGAFEAGAPAPLFRIDAPGWDGYGNAFDAAPDGQRFLIQTGTASLPFTVVRNWTADLKR